MDETQHQDLPSPKEGVEIPKEEVQEMATCFRPYLSDSENPKRR